MMSTLIKEQLLAAYRFRQRWASSEAAVLEVRSLLERCGYRPGWTITAHPTPVGPYVWILIDAEVPDSESHARTTRIGVRAVVPYFDDDPDFFHWLAWRLQRIERHECREFFWVDGQPWDSPHKVPQPQHDYLVRKHETDGWQVKRHDDVVVGLGWQTQQEAYEAAWMLVIADDLHKADEFVNG